MKALIVGDIHLADKPPSMRTEAYSQQILAKLQQTVDIAQGAKVDSVIWVGDVFHSKVPARTSHALVQKLIRLGDQYPGRWYIVPGNHDVSSDRLDSLSSQPLGVLFESGKAVPLVGAAADLPLYGIPWLLDWDEFPDWVARCPLETELAVLHAPIVPEHYGSQPFWTVPYEQLSRLPSHVVYGHIHEAHGVWRLGESQYFCNMGAISRGSLHEVDLKREPAVVIFDSSRSLGERFRPVPLQFEPVQAVFRVPVEKAERAPLTLEAFLSGVEATVLTGLSIEQVLDHVASLGLDRAVSDLIAELLEYARAAA